MVVGAINAVVGVFCCIAAVSLPHRLALCSRLLLLCGAAGEDTSTSSSLCVCEVAVGRRESGSLDTSWGMSV